MAQGTPGLGWWGCPLLGANGVFACPCWVQAERTRDTDRSWCSRLVGKEGSWDSVLLQGQGLLVEGDPGPLLVVVVGINTGPAWSAGGV